MRRLFIRNGAYVGLGSDHTDRKAEAVGVSLSKQMCAKPVSRDLWRWEDVAPHWDALVLRSYVSVNGKRRLYQEGPVTAMRPLPELFKLYGDREQVTGRHGHVLRYARSPRRDCARGEI